jgi:hypothetical protein
MIELSFTPWDIILIVAASVQATIVAYVRPPRWKAAIFSVPIPFTLMTLAAGRPVDATNVLGLILLLGFVHAVRWLHRERGAPIVAAIVASALGYALAGSSLAAVVPRTGGSFWLAVGGTLSVGLVSLAFAYHRDGSPRGGIEPGGRTALPPWVKWPIIVAVILFLVAARKWLMGFATAFPLIGVITAYEARRSLWTVARQTSEVMMAVTAMNVTSHLAAPFVGLAPSLTLAWVAWAAVAAPGMRFLWQRQAVTTGRAFGYVTE